jgi:hypothetical protein
VAKSNQGETNSALDEDSVNSVENLGVKKALCKYISEIVIKT